MKEALYFAAFLLVAVGVAHSYLGEKYILIRLFRRPDLPKLFGGTEFTSRTLRFAWHITSIAWWGFAAVLVLLAHPPITTQALGWVLGSTLLLTSSAILVGSRGKHLAWPLFLIAGIVALYAAGT
ncbi:MAG: hypothetical protein ACRETN_10720 [Nevskiales bacterium]